MSHNLPSKSASFFRFFVIGLLGSMLKFRVWHSQFCKKRGFLMKKILYIARTDIKNIVTNPAAIIVIAALAFLPSLYAWLNIAASWDPYANTQGVSVAVVSLDEGAEIQDEEINIGDEIVVSLTKNDKLGWQFVSEDDAIDGVKSGEYYAAIVIPRDFSEKLTSVISDDIQKPRLEYYINEKVNAISPKVTGSGASAIVENIRANFVEEANQAVMTIFNTLGIELEENHVDIENMRDKLFELEEALPDLQAQLRLAQRDLDLADFSIDKAHDGLDRINDIDDRAKRLNNDLERVLKESQDSVDSTIESITKKLKSSQDTFRKIPDSTSEIAKKGEDLDSLIASLHERQDGLDDVSQRVNEIYEFLKEYDQNWKDSSTIVEMMGRLKENEQSLRNTSQELQQIIDKFQNGGHPTVEQLGNIRDRVQGMIENTDKIIADYNDVILPRLKELAQSFKDRANSIDNIINLNNQAIALIDELLAGGDPANNAGILDQLDKIAQQIGGIIGADTSFIQDAIKGVQQGTTEGLKLAKEQLELSNNSLRKLQDRLNAFEKDVERLDERMQDAFKRIQEAQQDLLHAVRLLEDAAQNPEGSIKALEAAVSLLNSSADAMQNMYDGLGRFQDFVDSDTVTNEINRLLDFRNKLENTKDSLDNMIDRIENTKDSGRKVLDNIDESAMNMVNSLQDMIDYINNELGPKYKDLTNSGIDTLHDITKVLNDVNGKIPKVRDGLEKIRDGVGVGQEKLDYINEHFPEAAEAIENAADRIREIEEKGDLDDFINMLRNDPSRVSDFFAEPVILDEHKLYPIPNYGSAMNPFYTTLSLWVGALLMVSSLKVDVERKERFKSYQTYFGRLITFLMIGIAQSFIVAMGDIFILKAFVVDKLFFVIFAIIISISFVTIVYTFVSVFGNTGKVLAIILMVMQLGGSGGTFPIQMAPEFFQRIHAFLPFTHAISLLREAVGGTVWSVAAVHIAYLIVYMLLAITVGVGLKQFFNRSSDKFMEKAQKSKIVI